MKGQTMTSRSVWHVCLLILAVVQLATPTSAQVTTPTPTPIPPSITTSRPAPPSNYLTRPANLTVPIGDPAVFRCGVAPNINFTFTLYGSQDNYTLTCPGDDPVDDIPQALYGNCQREPGRLLAVWTIRGTSIPDNGTRLVCRLSQSSTEAVAVLKVFDNRVGYFLLIGCTIGGFFGILLVFGFLFVMLQRSESFQECFRGKPTEEDMENVIPQAEKSGKKI